MTNFLLYLPNLYPTIMTPRSFWAILIKILGLYIILESLASVPNFLGSVYYVFSTTFGQDNSGFLFLTLYYIVVICVYGLLFYYCLFKTDWIIDKLKLDKGFEDERFEFNIHRSTVLKIIIMVTGGVLLVDSVPMLCRQILSYIQERNKYISPVSHPATGYIIIYSVKIFIGYFMLTCSRMMINFMEARRKKAGMDLAEEEA
jgi:hypothetical protein